MRQSMGCHVECDGGGFALENPGESLLRGSWTRASASTAATRRTVRPTPGADDKAFRVEKVAEAQCRALEKATLGR